METVLTLFPPAVLALLLCRVFLTPIKLGLHAGAGFLCLWLINTVSGFTGVYLPVNPVTVLIAGACGVPGLGLLALLALL